MTYRIRKNLIIALLCVFCAALIASVILLAVNIPGRHTAVPFAEKLVLNLRDGNETQEEYTASVTIRYAETFSCKHGEIENDRQLEEHRNELRAYYEKRNEKIVKELNLADYIDSSYSFYGPFIEYRYNAADDFLASDLFRVKATDCEILENVFVEEHTFADDATRNGDREFYPFVNALRDVGLDRKEFTGKGVKVGIVENGVPDRTVNLSGVKYETHGVNLTSHSFQTSSIIGANSGIATDVELYFAALQDYTFVQCSNWFIEKGVNLINRSNGGGSGTYTVHSAFADYLVRQAKMTFINSAGNDGDNNISGYPGTGLNVISVASNDWNKAISSFSSAGMKEGQTVSLANPTLTAPGGSLYGIPNVSGAISGTSFAAPMTTGVVALLMEEFPELKYKPEKVTALLINSCTPARGQTKIWDHDAGFGIVNYRLARENYKNSTLFTTPKAVSPKETVLCEREVSISFDGLMNAKAAVMFNSNYSTTPNNANLTSADVQYSDIKVQLLNASTGEVVAVGDTISNFTYLKFTNETYEDEDYTTDFKLRVLLKSDKAFVEAEDCALNIRVEEADEPFGLVFSDGRYYQDADVIENDFYYEAFAAGYEINAIYVLTPDGEDYELYENKTLIPVGSCAGDYTFYIEYLDEDGYKTDSYELTITLNAINVELFRGGESVYTATVYGSDPVIDSEIVFKWGDILKISATVPEGTCSLDLNEDIVISRDEYDIGEYEITFTSYSGEDIVIIIYIEPEPPKLIVGGKSYGDGDSITVKEALVLNLRICDEGESAYIRITDEDGVEQYYDSPSDAEIILSAELGTKKVYTVEMCDEFGNIVTLTLTIDNVPEQGGLTTIILVVALVLVIAGATAVIIVVFRKKRKRQRNN